MTKADQLAAGLDEFLAVSPDVEAAAVVSADGLPMASALPPYVEEDRLAAMSAALLTLGERAASGMGKGRLAQVFVEAGDGYVVLMAAGINAVLVAITSGAAKVGLVLFEMRKAAGRIVEIMEADSVPGIPRRDAGTQTNGTVPAAESSVASNPPPYLPEPPSPSESAFSTWH
jgi:predicted regulator of Ras-like GTPase activity (Roadblock/LC7/MglB family)